jgi:hypothetical protein
MTHIKTRTQITKTRRKTLSPSPKMISWHWQLKYRRYKLLENKITSTVGNTNHLRMENKISRRFFKMGTYYWCTHHKMWTRHKPSECKRYPVRTAIKKKQSYKDKKKACIQAKAALLNIILALIVMKIPTQMENIHNQTNQ